MSEEPIKKTEFERESADETVSEGKVSEETRPEEGQAVEIGKHWNYEERRIEERKKIYLKKPFHAEIHLDEVCKTYIYIVDISHGGMKIMTDLSIPDKVEFTIKLLMRETISFVVETIWQRQVLGYMNAIGLRFVELSPEATNMIEGIMNKFAIDTSKKAYSLNKMVNLQIQEEGQWKNLYAYIIEMSPAGLEYTTDYIFPINEEFILRAFLIAGEPPIEVRAKIVSEADLSMNRTMGFIEFVEIDERSKLRLSEHIVKLLQGELPRQILAPIEDFELPG